MVVELTRTGMLARAKEVLTTSVFARPSEYRTVDSALEFVNKAGVKDSSKKSVSAFSGSNILSKIKIGHLAGPALVAYGIFNQYIREKLADDSIFKVFVPKGSGSLSVFGGIAAFLIALFGKNTYEETINNILDKYVEKCKVSEDGSSRTAKDVDAFCFPSLDQVVLSSENEGQLLNALSQARNRGLVINARGIVRCGKTMTAKAIARKLAQQSQCKSAQYWNATENTMEQTIADYLAPLSSFLGIKIGDTISERVERLIANALIHYKQTGEPVVIVLDEAHKLLGFDNFAASMLGGFDPSDPKHRSAVSTALGKLFNDKLKQDKCQGVVLVLTSNSAAKDMSEHMKGRFDADMFYQKPDQEMRKNLIKLILNDELVKNKDRTTVQFQDFADSEFKELADIGTLDLVEHFAVAIGGNKDASVTIDEARSAGLSGCLGLLQAYNILHCEQIESTVRGSVYRCIEQSGDKDSLKSMISSTLQSLVEKEVKERGWIDEIRYYYASKDSLKDLLAEVSRKEKKDKS